MRRRDYRCINGHVFEFVDSMRDPIIRYLPCPTCTQPAERQIVARITIGAIKGTGWVTDFPGGRSLPTDEVERRLDKKVPEAFSDTYLEQSRAKRAEQVERVMAKQDAGELKPPAELSQHQKDVLTKALKPA